MLNEFKKLFGLGVDETAETDDELTNFVRKVPATFDDLVISCGSAIYAINGVVKRLCEGGESVNHAPLVDEVIEVIMPVARFVEAEINPAEIDTILNDMVDLERGFTSLQFNGGDSFIRILFALNEALATTIKYATLKTTFKYKWRMAMMELANSSWGGTSYKEMVKITDK